MKLNVSLYSNGALEAFMAVMYCIAIQRRKCAKFLIFISPPKPLFPIPHSLNLVCLYYFK